MAETATKEQILTAAWTVMTTDGMRAFSMRHLAKEVGVSASTLYWHFKNKTTIFIAMADQVCGEALAQMTNEGDWQRQLLADGLALAEVLRRSKVAAELLLSIPPDATNYLQLYERFLTDVDGLKLTDLEKFNVISIYVNYILTFERDYQLQTQNQPQATDDVALVHTVPILARMRAQGLFKNVGTPATLRWSLATLITGFDQQQRK